MSQPQEPFKVGEKVARVHGPGSHGIVKEIREETMSQGDSRDKERPYVVGVHWDNGTVSYFGPQGLKRVE